MEMKKQIILLFNRFRTILSRKVLFILGIGAAGFIFEACYGVPQYDDLNKNYELRGKVVNDEGNAAADELIIASSANDNGQTLTDKDGSFVIQIEGIPGDKVTVSMRDGTEKSTVILPAFKNIVSLALDSQP
jgi:hypothetical protein